MKAIFEFDFDKEGSDDRLSFKQMSKAADYYCALFDIEQYIRLLYKNDKESVTIEELRKEFYEIIESWKVDLND
jgi:hypothetical protein